MISCAYSDKLVAQSGCEKSPSAEKPKQVAEALKALPWVKFIDPDPVSVEDFYLCHDKKYVDDVLALRCPNGFGTYSKSVADSLQYTSGAMFTAAKKATKDMSAAALVSGFHHAGYAGFEEFGLFCTFNGLMVTAAKLLQEDMKKVAIVDLDMHWGNGTDDILYGKEWADKFARGRQSETSDKFGKKGTENVFHRSLGRIYHSPQHAKAYMDYVQRYLPNDLMCFKPDVILYQAGADVDVSDPYGGVLTPDQIMERDRLVFKAARDLSIPLAWNLAGGYQRDPDGGISKVLKIHLNTFEAAKETYTI